MYQTRRKKIAKQLQMKKIPWLALVPGPNLYYYTGLSLKQTERISFALISDQGDLVFILPEVEHSKVNDIDSLETIVYPDKAGIESIVFHRFFEELEKSAIAVENNQMRLMEAEILRALGFTKLVPFSKDIYAERVIKCEEEIVNIQNAVNILESSLEKMLGEIRPGMTELEVASLLEYEMKRAGSKGTPFETIVASGSRASIPHGRASNKKIEYGELMILDFGAYYNGYVGDMSRTVAIGHVSPKQKQIYEIVKTAQELALSIIKPGTTPHQIDTTAREYIAENGYGEHFHHRTGHGMGIEAHEEPYIRQGNKEPLSPGMVFTVEPGIYLQNELGVRIEDNVIVTEDGYRNFMTFTKELMIIGA